MQAVNREVISPEEWKIREDLAALYRLVAHFRMTDIIDTHITAKLPGPGHSFLINRYGVMFHEMRASDLIKIDEHGVVTDERAKTDPESCFVNAAGFNIHGAVHLAREDAGFVIHTHTAAGTGVSAQEDGLLPISQHALKFYNRVAYHGYEGIALLSSERERLVRDLGAHHEVMILRNHGLLALGRTAAEAFHNIYFLERACQIQIQALAGNAKLVFPPKDVCELTAEQFSSSDRPKITNLVWQAGLRLIEDAKSDFRV